MTIGKRKKNSRQRGYTSHGWGSMKKHRGAGHRGGRGHSGSGKRGDQKKPRYWHKKKYFGNYGFKSKSRSPEETAINIKTIEDRFDKLLELKQIIKEGDQYVLDLSNLGYNKLLSTGTTTKKLKITVFTATQKAIEKITSAGGEVITIKKKKEKKQKAAEKKKDPKDKDESN